MAEYIQFRNHILGAMAAEDLNQIRPHLRRVKLSAGQILYRPGDEVDCVYFPESGLVSLITSMLDGHEVESTSRGRDGAIAYVEACGSEVMVSCVRVAIKGEAWILPVGRYKEAYDRSPRLRNQIHRRTEILLADARQASVCRAVHPASGRLVRALLEAYDHTGEQRLTLTHEYLADLIGVGRTTVTHAASRLQSQKLIRYSRGVVVIVDLDGLKRRTCECYEVLRHARERILDRPARFEGCSTASFTARDLPAGASVHYQTDGPRPI